MLNRLLSILLMSGLLAACASLDGPAPDGEAGMMSGDKAMAEAPPPDLPATSDSETMTNMAESDTPAPAPAATLPNEYTVYFDYESDILTPEAESILDQVAAAALAKGSGRIDVQGHTDARGSRQQNDRMSRRRAQQVADALVFRGIDLNSMQVTWVGADQLAVPTDGQTREQANRRVVISLH